MASREPFDEAAWQRLLLKRSRLRKSQLAHNLDVALREIKDVVEDHKILRLRPTYAEQLAWVRLVLWMKRIAPPRVREQECDECSRLQYELHAAQAECEELAYERASLERQIDGIS